MKTFVKAAREALNAKEYNRVVNIAETGLADDEASEPENVQHCYMLMVFRALALHHLGQDPEAIESYERAGISQLALPFAWQGLVNLYEETGADPSKLVRPLEALLPIYKTSGEVRKHKDTVLKLLPILVSTKNYVVAGRHFEWILTEGQSSFYTSLDDNDKPDYKSLLLAYIECREAQDSDRIAAEVQKRRFRLGAGPLPLIRAQVEAEIMKDSDLEVWCARVLELCPDDLEMAVKHAKFLGKKAPFLGSPIEKTEALERIGKVLQLAFDEELFELLLDTSDDAHVDGSMRKYAEKGTGRLVSECKYRLEMTDEAFPIDKSSLFSAHTAAKRLFSREEYDGLLSDALPALKQAIKAVEAKYAVELSNIKKEAGLFEFLVLVRTSRFEAALPLAANFDDHASIDIFQAKFALFTSLGLAQEAINLLEGALQKDKNDPELLSDTAWQYFILGQYEKARDYLDAADAHLSDNPSILYRLGRTHWAQGNKLEALSCYLRTVKADPEHALAFLALGTYYEGEKDLVRAEKCFSRSLKLDGSLVEAAVSLAGIWTRRAWSDRSLRPGTAGRIIALLEPFTQDYLRNYKLWKCYGTALGWIRQGGSSTKSASALQTALKAEHADELECLLLLAEAYRSDRKLSAAGKAYARALEVSPGSRLARIGAATVKMETRSFEEAITMFAELLDDAEDGHREALKAQLSKTHYLFAKELLLESEYERAFEQIRFGLSAVLLDNAALLSTWKVTADLCALVSEYNAHFKDITAPNVSLSDDLSIVAEVREHITEPFLLASALSLINCLSLTCSHSIQADLWLSIAQYAHTCHAYDLAETCLLQALRLAKRNAEAWNLYGLIAMQQGRLPLAQHAFISSLAIVESGHAWLNLGLLYTRLGDAHLALQAVERALMTDVDSPASWWAQSQLVGSPEKCHELLLEAFKCSKASRYAHINIAYFRESWKNLVLRLTDDEDLGILELALRRIVNLVPGSAYFTNVYGLVLERLDKHDSRLEALFTSCLHHHPAGKKNLFRVLVLAGKFKEAEALGCDDTTSYYEYLCKLMAAALKQDRSLIAEYTTQHTDIGESAIWESAKICINSGSDLSWLTPNPVPASASTLLFLMATEEDSEAASAPLMQLLELVNDDTETPAPEILWVLTRYLMWRGCYLEAFHFYMSVLENHILDSKLREGLAEMLDEVAEEQVKAEVSVAVKTWLDNEVPQLTPKPTLEQLDEWYSRLFPIVIEAATFTV